MAGCTFAADKPNLSGKWTVDLEKSDFGMLPPPSKLERNINHSDPQFTVSTVQATPRGERTSEAKCTTDGKECDIQIMGQAAKMKATWEGEVLVVVTKAQLQGTELEQIERWMVEDGGKVLKTVSKLRLPQGENESTLIFTKAD